MTEEQTRTATDTGAIPQQRPSGGLPVSEPAPGSGWVIFAGAVMAVIGAFGVIEGLAALFAPTYFITVGGSVLVVNLSAWGWVHLVLGVLALVTGFALLGGAPNWARGVGIGLVALNMLVQFAWLPAFPIWAIIVIALDVVIIGALAATWNTGTARHGR